MGQTGHGYICCKYKGDMWYSADKKDSKVSNINTDLIEYVPKILVKKEVINISNILILLLKLPSLFLFLGQRRYPIHTKIQYHQHLFAKLIYQHLILHAKMLFLIKSVIYITVQHHIP